MHGGWTDAQNLLKRSSILDAGLHVPAMSMYTPPQCAKISRLQSYALDEPLH